MKMSFRKGLAAAAIASLGLAALQPATASASPAAAPSSAAAPSFDLKADCPKLPAGADPARWECLVMVVDGGSLKLGGLSQQITEPITIVVQSGPPAGGGPNELKEIRMDADPMKIPGGVLGLLGLPSVPWLEDLPGFKVEVEASYAGGFSFALPVAKVDMRVRIINLLLGDACYIGTQAEPLKFTLVADMSTIRVVSPGDPSDPLAHPFVIAATAADKTFTVPRSSCGIWGAAIDWKAALPSPSGSNEAAFETFIAVATYQGTGTPLRDPRTLKVG
ncbi:hypothetical protein [Actinomadura rugatobispora]|uniref:Secreted protein n=1 Tax=Actinomadura rugatobispora TaxID=1994 RepID=A0ABW1A6J7_9ACTN|nr:hypothetical protein GCM10010200_013600 [Actinomadura rugatobispora]